MGPRPRKLTKNLIVWFCLVGGISIAHGRDGPLRMTDTQLEPIEWKAIEGWADDDHAKAFVTFKDSCDLFLRRKRRGVNDPRPIHAALRDICRHVAGVEPVTTAKARAFFETHFRPVKISRLGEVTGMITGYYEPVVFGSRFPNPEFHVPIYRRPPDLLVAGKKPSVAGVPNRASIVRRNAKGDLEPYHDRAAIERGALDGQKLEIAWLRDPFEALSIQIQGSARVKLEDGLTLRINYDAHNGHSYTAVGRILIERNLVPRDEMSMQRISQWMRANPREAPEIRHSNRSFVFFRITGLSDDVEPIGAQGVHLTPERSIAVDKNLHVYGTPFFIAAELPIDSARPTTKFRRLMIAQDTGSAIIGPARADLYWGAGDLAGKIAGRMRHQGRYVMLLPKSLDMIAAGKLMPVPVARPANAPAPVPIEPEKKEEPEVAKEKPADTATKDKIQDNTARDKAQPPTPPAKPPLPRPRASLAPERPAAPSPNPKR
jgi:membrane-bound lytic murein transglycosylase A